jgi:hypothetical protein
MAEFVHLQLEQLRAAVIDEQATRAVPLGRGQHSAAAQLAWTADGGFSIDGRSVRPSRYYAPRATLLVGCPTVPAARATPECFSRVQLEALFRSHTARRTWDTIKLTHEHGRAGDTQPLGHAVAGAFVDGRPLVAFYANEAAMDYVGEGCAFLSIDFARGANGLPTHINHVALTADPAEGAATAVCEIQDSVILGPTERIERGMALIDKAGGSLPGFGAVA